MSFEAFMNRNRSRWLVVVPLALQLAAGTACSADGLHRSPNSSQPDLEYLKAVNQMGPPEDAQLLFLLMGQYASANRHAEGAEFFSARLKEFGQRLTDPQKALYLSAIALLRAQHADAVPLLQRIGWVKETLATLDRAK